MYRDQCKPDYSFELHALPIASQEIKTKDRNLLDGTDCLRRALWGSEYVVANHEIGVQYF